MDLSAVTRICYRYLCCFFCRYKAVEIEQIGRDEWNRRKAARDRAYRWRKIEKLKAAWAKFVRDNPGKQLKSITPDEVGSLSRMQ